jgi:hypothetical protein
MKKSLLLLASAGCLGLFAIGCEGSDENPCENYTCLPGQECVENDFGIFGKLASCSATTELCEQLTKSNADSNYQLQNHPTKGTICVDQNASNDSGTTDDGACYKNSDCEEAAGEVCDTATGYCEIPAKADEYRYLRIDDLSPKTSDGEDPGADIDAVVLQKKEGGKLYYATDVIGYQRGDGGSTKADDLDHAYNPAAAKGAPDSIVDYTNPDGKCNYLNVNRDGYTFVSLGGEGGYLILEMGAAIENGDTLYVAETGDCSLVKDTTRSKKGGTARAENFKVSVATSKNATDDDWRIVISSGTAKKGIVSAVVASLQ